jgi:N-acetylglucosamine-6-phosphate deacetylase
MIFLSGARVVLPDRTLPSATVIVEGARIVDVVDGVRTGGDTDEPIPLDGHIVVPGFVDVHVHGVEGVDALDDGDPIAELARRLPRFGVTAFCPTSIACDPPTLERMLAAVALARSKPPAGARVLPAHLESNFINPEFKGGQPLDCLRAPRGGSRDGEFTGDEILAVIAARRTEVGIVTVAPELDGALDLVRDLVSHGHVVSLGHSGATYEQGLAGIDAGARQATHLFNRMPPLTHRAPGLAGAVLEHDAVAAEVVCDLVHVHPSFLKLALAAKSPERFMAITDGTAGSGLPRGATAMLGDREITIRDAAYLADGTLAGSAIAMDRAFANLVTKLGVELHDAAAVCSATPARQLGLAGRGTIAPGAPADLAVLDASLSVVRTLVDGRTVFAV